MVAKNKTIVLAAALVLCLSFGVGIYLHSASKQTKYSEGFGPNTRIELKDEPISESTREVITKGVEGDPFNKDIGIAVFWCWQGIRRPALF